MAGEGMVAVVQGLRDCGLAVALLDEDGKTYTLVPKAVERKTTATAPYPTQCDAGAQATDGRYATVYQVHHCKMTPTSPPNNLTEFPPQRAEVSPGHDNFEVGGTGSGETYMPVKSSNYRGGGMCWTDRGSVCSPRPSRDPDAFASSLRKYPASPDRSAEVVERLISYSQHNNYRSPLRHYSPPCRACEHVSSHCSARSSRQGAYDAEGSFVKRQRSPEDYPTRERRGYDSDLVRKSTFCKNNDVRIVRDISKRLKDSIKSTSSYTVAPHACTDTRDRYEAPTSETCNSNAVNIEIQAAASMVSRKVSTVPLPIPIRRTVAIPLSPTSSDSRPDQTVRLPIDPSITRSVQTIDKPLHGKSVQTASSFTEIPIKRVKVATRKSKSFSDFAIDKKLKDEILEWLDDASDPKVKRLHDAVLKKLSGRLKINFEKLKVKNDCDKCHDKLFKERIASELHRMHVHCCYACKSADMLRIGMNEPYNDTVYNEQNNYDNVLKEWINDISIKKRDLLRPVIKEQVYNTFVKRLKHSAVKKSVFYKEHSLRAEILDLLDEVPIDFHGFSKKIYLNTLVDALITKLENISEEQKEPKHHWNEDLDRSIPQTSRHYSQPIAKEKRLLARKMNTTKTKKKSAYIGEMEADVSDVLIDSINIGHSFNDSLASEEIDVLLNNITKLPENEAVEFAMQLTENLKDRLNKIRAIASQPKTVLLLQNTSKINTTHANNKTEINIPEVDDKDVDAELNKYMNELAEQIEEWLSKLKVGQAHDKEFRQAAVNDLASDIIDRHKYLELSNNRGSDIDELEHLKYQIFKWINKLVGEDNTETIEHAADLMQRIKNIPVPILSTLQDQVGLPDSDVRHLCAHKEVICSKCKTYTNIAKDKIRRGDYQKNQMPTEWHPQTVFTAATNNQSKNDSSQGFKNSQQPGSVGFCSKNYKGSKSSLEASRSQSNSPGDDSGKPVMSSLRPPCCPGPANGTPSMKQLNEEYDAYVTNWVTEIPIPANTPEEAAIAEKARLGIHNGIWKAITKLKFEPATFHNKFLYEDVLEEEIDELLNLLPQTPELQDKRHFLKVKLIEKTSDTNELLWTAATPASYKQQLVQQVASNLPRRVVDTDEEDPNKLFEDMLILCIADDFILSARYKDEDKVKANAYRNKVIRKIEAIIDEVKKTHGKEVQDLNNELCINDVVSALHKVPLPTEETIRQEADEILLGLEIEQWFNDLPIVKNDDRTEQLHRRRLRDALAKKLHELEKEVNIADCSGEPKFKHEISMFLEKVPLEQDESLNINFMVDELTNRMKNRDKLTNKRKTVAFQDGQPEYKEPQGRADEPSSQLQSCPGRQDASNQSNVSWSDSMNPGHQYDAFSNDVPACSSMINPAPAHQEFYNAPPPDYRQWGLDSSARSLGPNLAYVPGKFHEENLGGGFGYSPHGQMPMSSERYAYPDLVDSPNAISQGPMMGTCRAPLFQDQSGGMQSSFGRAPQDMNSAIARSMHSDQGGAMPQTCPGMPQNMNPAPAPAHDRSMDMSSFRRFGNERPPSSSWNEVSGEFVSLLHDSKGPPQQSDQGGAMPQTCPGMSQNMNPAPAPAYDRSMDMSSFRRFGNDRPPSSSWKEVSGEFVSLLHDSKGPPQQSDQGGAMPQTCPGMSQNMNPAPAPAYDRSMDMSSFRRFGNDRPPSSSWKEVSGEFVSLLHDSKGPPQQSDQGGAMPQTCPGMSQNMNPAPAPAHDRSMDTSSFRRFGNERPQPRAPPTSPQRTVLDPYMQPSEQTLGGRFGPNNTQASHPCQNCSQRAASPTRPDQPPEPRQPASLGIDQYQTGQPSVHTSQVRPNAPNVSQTADRCVRGPGLAADFNKTTARDGFQQTIDHNKSANTSFQRMDQDRSAFPQPVPREETRNRCTRTCPHVTIDDASNRNVPSPSFNDQDQRFLAPDQPPTGVSISNQPVGSSTPNQRSSNAQPPNIKARRQNERDRNYRRVDSETDDDGEEVRVRCQCIERFNKRCKKKRGSFFGCDDCMEGFPYYFPMGCPYPYFFNGR